jgi:hypothetical protein
LQSAKIDHPEGTRTIPVSPPPQLAMNFALICSAR